MLLKNTMDKRLYIYAPILIAAGVTQKYLYYQAFNLRILDYQEFGETLSLISESLVGLILIIPFTWYLSFILDLKKEHISQPENYEGLIKSAHKEIKFAKRISLYLLRY